MRSSAPYLNPSDAAERLGVSAKALRLYEQRGLLVPSRSAAGWRAYGPQHMACAAEIVALRALGLSLAEVARVLSGDAQDLEPALAGHQQSLEARIGQLHAAVEKVRALRADLGRGQPPEAGALTRLLGSTSGPGVAFDLPWPWGGERFALPGIGALTFITGPLGSGKTRLARLIAETIPSGQFIGLERLSEDAAVTQARLDEDCALKARVERALRWLVDEGATTGPALVALLARLEADGPAVLVVDMVEQGLDQTTQEAVIAHLRRRAPAAPPLVLMTRSSAILDLAATAPGEAIIFCPANHAPPIRVLPQPGTPGYEAVATCLASPAVRARTEGVVVVRPTAHPSSSTRRPSWSMPD